MRSGVVGGDDQESAFHPGVGRAHQGVAGHVQSHLLHAGRRPTPGITDREGGFEGHFLIDGPFPHGRALGGLGHLDEGGKDLGGRRPRVGGGERAPVLQKPPGDGLIPQKNFLQFFLLQIHSLPIH
jgi:hypothetical protein